jgi:hypothetical protein
LSPAGRRAAALLLLAVVGAARAGSDASRFCDRSAPLTAAQQDRLLRFAEVARQELDAAGGQVALVARSGLDLSRFGLRYSHAGLSLRDAGHGPWAVRQLYFACDEGRPRLFDQGLAGFVSGTDDPSVGYLSIVLLPTAAGEGVSRAVQDKALALSLLSGAYSANAYAWGTRYQNCNQWVAELLATSWGATPDAGAPRAAAQRWLAAAGFDPAPVRVDSHALMFAGGFIPWIRFDDHPEDDRYALQFRTVVPASLEAFVRAREPQARRIELCHTEHHVLVRHGWAPLADGCRPGPGDRVVALDP